MPSSGLMCRGAERGEGLLAVSVREVPQFSTYSLAEETGAASAAAAIRFPAVHKGIGDKLAMLRP